MADQDDVDFTTLPLEQRASHKVWKARLNAYQELNNLFTKSSVISPPNDVANYWLDPELFASYIVEDVYKRQSLGCCLGGIVPSYFSNILLRSRC